MAAAAAGEFAGFARGAFGNAWIPLHFVDDIKIRIVHCSWWAGGCAVAITGPVAGIATTRNVKVVRNANSILWRGACAQTSSQLHLLLFLLLHNVLDRSPVDVFGVDFSVDDVPARGVCLIAENVVLDVHEILIIAVNSSLRVNVSWAVRIWGYRSSGCTVHRWLLRTRSYRPPGIIFWRSLQTVRIWKWRHCLRRVFCIHWSSTRCRVK